MKRKDESWVIHEGFDEDENDVNHLVFTVTRCQQNWTPVTDFGADGFHHHHHHQKHQLRELSSSKFAAPMRDLNLTTSSEAVLDACSWGLITDITAGNSYKSDLYVPFKADSLFFPPIFLLRLTRILCFYCISFVCLLVGGFVSRFRPKLLNGLSQNSW